MPSSRERLIRLLQNPRVEAFLQNPRTMEVAMRAVRAQNRFRERLDDGMDAVARRLNLATKREIRELKRTIRQLQEEQRR